MAYSRMRSRLLKRKIHPRSHRGDQQQGLQTEAHTSTTRDASPDDQVNLDGLPPPGSSGLKQSSAPTDSDTPIRELWNLAYTNLRKEDEKLVVEYEARLCGDLSAGLVLTLGSKVSIRDRMEAILQRKMDEVNRDIWKLKFGSSDVQVRELVQPILSVVNQTNNFINAAVSANPYASLAWTGISILLPLFLNTSEQIGSLAKGLDHISSLLTQSWMWEDLYVRRYESEHNIHKSSMLSHAAYKTALEKLYRQILKFQATSYCYYARKTISRVGLDVLKWNEWDTLLSEIKDKEDAFSAIRDSWSDEQFDEECSAAASRHQEIIGHWQAIGSDVSRLREAVRESQEEKNRDQFLDWLSNIDPSEMYNSARDQHESGTCDWLVRDREEFKKWKTSPRSLLWLHGKPGCGKSILSSSVVSYLQERYTSDAGSAFAYFFFSFSDTEKQKVDTMLSSLLKQLYVSRPDTPQVIKNLDVYKQKGMRPDTKTLEDAIRACASGFSSVSLVIDALEECPTVNRERNKLLGSLGRIIATMPDHFHIFLTSRPEPDISAVLNDILIRPSSYRVAIDLTIDQGGINHDIGLYIDSRLASADYVSWPNHVKAKAKDLLMKRADGMFQYVVCQFRVLEKLGSAAEIDEALEQLPLGLSTTYDRVLQDIDPKFQARVVSMLKWLVASVRPLLIEELAEACIIHPESTVPFDVTHRLFTPKDCLKYISSLTVLHVRDTDDWEGGTRVERGTYVRLAHFSVREYLTSNRIADNQVATFLFTAFEAHLHIAHSSVAYHLYRTEMNKDAEFDLELEDYTTQHWASHLEMAPREIWPDNCVYLASRALALGSNSLRIMIRGKRNILAYPNVDNQDFSIFYFLHRPLCYTALLGHFKLTEILLSGSAKTDKYLGQQDLDEALDAAAYGGSIEVVQLLLDRGARVCAESGILEGALQSAASKGHAAIVNLLLDNGANVNAQHDKFGSALGIAVVHNHFHLVKLLVDRGADVNMPPNSGNPIIISALNSRNVDIKLVEYLLNRGADINRQSDTGETALHAAADNYSCSEALFRLLLEKGADINRQGGKYGNALQRMCCHEETQWGMVKFLLERGANVNSEGGVYNTALQAACSGFQNIELVEFLLEKGADVGSQGGMYGNALQAACSTGDLKVVQLLLERGADVNAPGGRFGSALQAAADNTSQNVELLELLLRKGAEVNKQGGYHHTALQAACSNGNLLAVRMLLDHGAEVNARGGKCGTALQAVFNIEDLRFNLRQHVAIVRLLIERGADIHAQGGVFGSAWHAAASTGTRNKPDEHQIEIRSWQLVSDCLSYVTEEQIREYRTSLHAALESEYTKRTIESDFSRIQDHKMVDQVFFLINRGTDINIRAGTYSFPLQSACAIKGGTRLAIFLLKNYRNLGINAVGGILGSALQAAAYSGQKHTVKLLLEKGADPNLNGGKYRSALNAAVLRGFRYIVEILLDHGAKSDRQLLSQPDEEWLARIQEGIEEEDGQENGETAVERYRIFWDRQPVSEGAI
ncbi:ankyrin repeat-containing domain protein [Xylaria sp. FL1777]|nr:ankyrin repeat-containing domain protein [Xylaria sp. FL1777]